MRWNLLAQLREPLPVPPLGVDLVVSLVFVWLSWLVWKHGGRYRAAAVILWIFAAGALISFLSGL